jgi:glutamate dehydrogenase (NAD(P)+)
MSQFGGPAFEMAQQQFHVIADHLEIPDDERNRLILPKRAITVCPIHMDDGRIAVFTGYRVQHHMTYGPASGHALRSQCRHRGSRSARGLDELEMRASRIAFRRRQKRVTVDPSVLSGTELENLSRRYMQELIPFVGPRVDVMAPVMGPTSK